MFVLNDDLSIYATRGDIVFFSVTAKDEKDGTLHKFKAGDVVTIKVYGKKNAETVELQKDFPIFADTEIVEIYLTKEDTTIGEVISKPKDYWYEVVLNDDTKAQTIIGYDEDGAKVFKLFPEGADLEEFVPTKEDIPFVDAELDLTSHRPVENQAIAREIISLKADFDETKEEVITRSKHAENEVNRIGGEVDTSIRDLTASVSVEKARIDNLVSKGTIGDEELLDVRVGADGKTYKSAGTAVREQFNKVFERVNTISGGDLNFVIESDRYVVVSDTITNFPSDINTTTKTFMLDVQRYNGRWITQIIHQLYSSVMYFRTGSVTNYSTHSTNFQEGLKTSFSEWVRVDNEEYDATDAEEQIIKYQTIDQSGVDLNTFNTRGNYTIAVTDSVNRPSVNGGYILRVKENGSFVIQTVYGVQGNYPMFWRIGKHATPMNWSNWFKVATSEDISTLSAAITSLSGEVENIKTEIGVVGENSYSIANMGDSITGNEQGVTSVSSFLASAVGATTHNLGFGGCRMSKHVSPWNAFSMYKLADAIVSGDFSEQDTAAANSAVPSYFKDTVSKMKGIDFSKIDIMTIAYGTNDFTSAKGLDNANNLYDTDYFGGALRYSLEKIGNAFPNIRFVIVAPCWRFWNDDNGNYLESSDQREINGVKLHNLVDKCVEIGKEYHLPVVNPYDEMAVNKFNRSWWFNQNDGTHPNENGRKSLARLMANTIKGM